jgi:opacity protein-like surface antigen
MRNNKLKFTASLLTCLSIGVATLAPSVCSAAPNVDAKNLMKQAGLLGKFGGTNRLPQSIPEHQSPLLKFTYAPSLAFTITNTPLVVKFSYGISRKSKLHDLSLVYNDCTGLRLGASVVYGTGKNDYYRERMPAFFADIGYTYLIKNFSPYAGVSLGYAEHNLMPLSAAKVSIPDKEANYSRLAYRFSTGLEMQLTRSIAFDIGYKIDNYGFKKAYRKSSNGGFNHTVLFGLKFVI